MSAGHQTPQRTDARSDADLVALGPDYARLAARALPDDVAFAAFGHLTDLALVALRTGSQATASLALPPRRSSAVVEAFDSADRDAERERLLVEMAHGSPERRRLLTEQALTLHSAVERKHLRRKALAEMRKAIVEHFGGMSDRAITSHILRDLRRRDGMAISTTGSALRDRLADRILAANGEVPSERTIREEIRLRHFGRNV